GDTAEAFIEFAIAAGVLRFGEFKTKAGRLSPYFFNAGLFYDGQRLGQLAGFYARRPQAATLEAALGFDMLFGPAYKGITLAACTAVAMAQSGRNIHFAYNRKEAKDHGEGGLIVGSNLNGRVLIIDDVISAGTSVAESVSLIKASGAEPAGVLIALDRQERSGSAEQIGAQSAVDDVQQRYGIPVLAIASLEDLVVYLERRKDPELSRWRAPLAAYRERYGSTRLRKS
ncbi:MAG: orotate phosphoribosyltransferase, partial [Betaproteobacteria bacterium]|nr:orotate phosphoribosyltransferase [Betaproteobacteria bacterium]